jgi:flagellar hook-associated protein 3 FlgL
MRISNETMRMAFLSAMEDVRQKVATTQRQLATGHRVNSPSDDPVAAARIANLDNALARMDQYQSNSGFARNQLGIEEEALNEGIGNLQRVRDLVLQANNATTTAADRRVIAAEIAELRDALLAIGNTTDTDGRYLFGGYSDSTTPFTVGATGAVTYNGDQGHRTLQISDSRFVAVNDSGADVFQKIVQGNGTFVLDVNAANTGTGALGPSSVTNPAAWVRDTYTITFVTPATYEVRDSANALVVSGGFTTGQSVAFAGVEVRIDGQPAAGDVFTLAPSAHQDVFATLEQLIAEVGVPAADPAQRAQLHSNLGQRLADVDAALAHFIGARGEIGARVRALDQQESMNADFSVHLNTTLSSVRDLDYAEALSRLSQELFGLDAAQQAYARTQNLSLFRYL